MPIHIPPLRERHEDIPLLVEHFITKFNERLKKTDRRGIAPTRSRALVSYHWPGNIRELENVIERTILFCEGPRIERRRTCRPRSPARRAPRRAVPGGVARRRRGEAALGLAQGRRARRDRARRARADSKALDETGGNVTQAARLLKISRKSLQMKMKEFGLRTA